MPVHIIAFLNNSDLRSEPEQSLAMATEEVLDLFHSLV